MNLYISDLHFGHKNVILFEHRPFSDVDTMDHCLIQRWNSRVSADDDVYIVGADLPVSLSIGRMV